MLAGREAARAVDAGQALPLTGGPLAFGALDVIWREARGPRETRRLLMGDFEHWRATLDGAQGVVLDRQFQHLTSSRPVLERIGSTAARRPLVMGIVNVTPDSFSDGGKFLKPDRAIAHGKRLIAEGADILDIGGESTRPGAEPITIAQELDRVLPVLDGLKDAGVPISIDTRHAEVMRASLDAGAHIINDVTALTGDPGSLAVAAAAQAPVVLMHKQGEPGTMQDAPRYNDAVLDIFDYLSARIEACETAGISRARLIVDPGIGFGKTLTHNLELLEGLAVFHALGVGLLLGASRKRFIAAIDPRAGEDERLGGSVAAALAGASRGFQIFRVHDVKETVQALSVSAAIAHARS